MSFYFYMIKFTCIRYEYTVTYSTALTGRMSGVFCKSRRQGHLVYLPRNQVSFKFAVLSLSVKLFPPFTFDYFLVFERFYVMTEAVANSESIESGGHISIEDEMKPEAVKNEDLPDNDLKQKHGRRKAAHTKLMNQLRKAVEDHKMGAIRLKKLQVAVWRDELIRIYEDVKDLHHKYMDSLPDITDPQRQACEKWEVRFDTDHVEIPNFTIRYATSSRHSVSSIGTSASDGTINTTLSQKRSTRSAPTDLPRQTSQLDLHIQKQMLEMEVKLEHSHVTSTEIASNTQLVKDSHRGPSNGDWHQQGTPENDSGASNLPTHGDPKRINVVSYDGATSKVQAAVVDFSLSSVDRTSRFEVKHAYAIDNLKVTLNPPINPRQMESCTHLRGLDVPNVQPEDVGVLIGLDVAEAHDHVDSVKPPAGTIGPIAFKTPFRWCLGGQTGPPQDGRPFIAHIVSEECSEDLNELVKRFWQLEAKDVDMEQPVLSEDDLRGKRILESTVKKVGNRYQVGLMWNTDNRDDFNEMETSPRRMMQLLRSKSAWITPDSSRPKSSGRSQVERGIYRATGFLLGVLLRFRRNLVPVGADIEKIFHQVKVPVEDQAAYCFVYRTPGSNQAPLTYQMTVHVFKSVSSPTTCIFVLNRTADDHRDQYPEAADSVRRNFYFDNYLDSFDSEDGAVKRARQMKKLLQLGGFNLTKRTSSSRKVISALREFSLASPTLDLDLEKLPIERTLGVVWNGETDMLTFKIRKQPSHDVLTKRNFLKELGQRFHYWYEHLDNLESLTVPRCSRHQRGRWTQQHLHVFTDASIKGFEAVAYFRFIFEDQSINVSFVMAKTHVTPVKGLTIPRLELQAAVEGLNITLVICRELEYESDWQDPPKHESKTMASRFRN
ncbi:Uncharacterized protein APZ42_033167 [Daphnia magna]|uniref:Uncharacterized protein n=1 Tax=Daphnia magna TaxID=35525 RepID=A0A164LBS6_9CRUS|nr:Uncharacterized protein APZ42_033167 [Daphnia magna]